MLLIINIEHVYLTYISIDVHKHKKLHLAAGLTEQCAQLQSPNNNRYV